MSTTAEAPALGKPLDRVDGRLKVTGRAKYAAEFHPPGTVHAYLVESTISKGRITAIDTAAAEKAPGVLAVLSHRNAPRLTQPKPDSTGSGGFMVEKRLPFSDDAISYGGQAAAAVVAATFEQARHAASLVRVTYAAETPALTFEDAPGTAKQPKQNMGDALQVDHGGTEKHLAAAEVRVSQTYRTPTETHNPIEPAAAVAQWEGQDRLVVHNSTQFVKGDQDILSRAFGLRPEAVRIICPFVGGGFGCKGVIWPHVFIAALAARQVGRPVKLPLTRPGMFTGAGNRTATEQTVTLGAARDGTLHAVRHDTKSFTSPVGEFIEGCGVTTSNVLYASPAIGFTHTVYTANVGQPSFMRAPGETPGTFALESAMDELAHELGLDPVALRLRNHADVHPVEGKPWSGKALKECYALGAEKFGWSRRHPKPGSLRDGPVLVGWGMAGATYPGYKFAAGARARLHADGTALVQCATHDLGTGAYTVFTQISADALALPMDKVKFDLGDSDLPYGPVAGGSCSTATVGDAIARAAQALHAKLAALAVADPGSPLYKSAPDHLTIAAPGRFVSRGDPATFDTFADIVSRAGQGSVEAEGFFKPDRSAAKVAFQSFGAHFCEVRIDPALPRVQVSRMVSVMNCGRILNPKTAGSQIRGGVIMGIGMALEEETVYDPKTGIPVTRSLADYHVPVHADIPGLEVHFVGEPDYQLTPSGARGVGEIGITGVAAAVANAVFHATGQRVRDLPITPDKLLRAARGAA